MSFFTDFFNFVEKSGPIAKWLMLFLVVGLILALGRSFFRARKIQPNSFNWKIFAHEIFFSILNLVVSGVLIGGLSKYLTEWGFITFNSEPASGWIIALEFLVYFFLFDCYFYWLHRLMHVQPIYTLVHKIHHRSISPNPLTTLSVNPLESLVNGGFIPLFAAAFTLHEASMAFIGPVNIIMGLYVHSGYEFFPRWWNKTWITKWFITTTFHDQHHRYFRGNYGGYTTIWDRFCGTIRPNFERDFDRVKSRVGKLKGIRVGV